MSGPPEEIGIMVSTMLLGFVLTGIALGAMLVWSYHEIARVDEIREGVDARLAKDREAQDQ